MAMKRTYNYSGGYAPPYQQAPAPYNGYGVPPGPQPGSKAQGYYTTYASRLRVAETSLLISQGLGAIPNLASPSLTGTRSSRRVLSAIKYTQSSSEEEDSSEDDDEEGGTAEGTGSAGAIQHKPKRVFPLPLPSYSEKDLAAAAEQPTVLIPIRLNLELSGSYRLTDFFLWNLSEQLITPEHFATVMCTDLDIPSQVYVSQIAHSIRTQLEEYAPVATLELPAEAGGIHVIVPLSVHLARHLYQDKFEWDLGSTLTPESFGKTIVQDLGLSGEFYPAIVHAIYEVLMRLKKEVVEGQGSLEVDNDAAYGAEAGWRVDQEGLGAEWGPLLEELTAEEIERREVERERNIRRLRRETAKFGDDTKKRRRKQSMY
ncbi:uncharacterized protein V1510DRAFT_418947 [Dipodascopsis tothii]|uniref:uncharacterized protein n=1 Tax=Dipodascopsis tothii TaxID=44089 RepID=UPI0034D008DF